MFSMDKILMDVVGQNWISLYILITLLKGVALVTPNTTDDKITTLIGNIFATVRSKKIPED